MNDRHTRAGVLLILFCSCVITCGETRGLRMLLGLPAKQARYLPPLTTTPDWRDFSTTVAYCFFKGQWYGPGTSIEPGLDKHGNLCYRAHCNEGVHLLVDPTCSEGLSATDGPMVG